MIPGCPFKRCPFTSSLGNTYSSGVDVRDKLRRSLHVGQPIDIALCKEAHEIVATWQPKDVSPRQKYFTRSDIGKGGPFLLVGSLGGHQIWEGPPSPQTTNRPVMFSVAVLVHDSVARMTRLWGPKVLGKMSSRHRTNGPLPKDVLLLWEKPICSNEWPGFPRVTTVMTRPLDWSTTHIEASLKPRRSSQTILQALSLSHSEGYHQTFPTGKWSSRNPA